MASRSAERQPWTLVWVDAGGAIVARWQAGHPALERLTSEVPVHHRSTGHVRHAATVRPGGGPPRSAGERHRLEHLRAFLDEVGGRIPADESVSIIGPGTVGERLAALVRDDDRRHRRQRPVLCRRSGRKTDAQLLAELRNLVASHQQGRLSSD